MQRWWYLDNKVKAGGPQSECSLPSKSIEISEKDRTWTFRVHVTLQLSSFESVGVTGDCATLGNWIPQNSVFLKNEGMLLFYFFLNILLPTVLLNMLLKSMNRHFLK